MYDTLHYLLMVDHLMLQKLLLAAIKDTGLTMGQPKVLDYLCEHEGAVQKDIAHACQIEPATLTSVLSGMENKGLIERRALNGNRRSLSVFLTDKGRQLTEHMEKEFCRLEEIAFSGFEEKEIGLSIDLLNRIRNNMQNKMEEL